MQKHRKYNENYLALFQETKEFLTKIRTLGRISYYLINLDYRADVTHNVKYFPSLSILFLVLYQPLVTH